MTRKSGFYAVVAATLQLLHALVFTIGADTTVLSNVVQVVISFATTLICLSRALDEVSTSTKRLWRQLSAAFFIWTTAQFIYTLPLLTTSVRIPSIISTVLWLLFPFPLLLVASNFTTASQQHRITSWLDIAQASLFFSTLFLLVLMKPSAMSPTVAYEFQSVALALACFMRYSMAVSVDERRFYRDLAIFAFAYALLSIVGYVAESHRFIAGSSIDLCWTFPFTAFTLLALRSPHRTRQRAREMRVASAMHLHGISASGLAVMSLSAAGLLALHYPLAGGSIVACAFILFAARTGVREWQMHHFQSRIQHALFHDALTGLGNRILLEEELGKKLGERNHDSQKGPALLFIDIDRFKSVNDSLGHTFGDRLLTNVATVLLNSTRSQDLVVRHGGDEFMVLLDEVSEENARVLADRILTLMRVPFVIDGRTIHLSASIGLVLSDVGDTPAMLLQDADCAMFKAKSMGKDRVQIFTPDILHAAKTKQTLSEDLRKTLESNQIEVHYQPIFELESKALHGFEALARWVHPERGLISPADFIPVAEETGLIVELGRQVLRKACIQCQRWNQVYKTSLTMSVNVSPYQLVGENLLTDLTEILEESRLPPALLKLEMTESALLSNEERIGVLLDTIRSYGISLSLDDFGTGYSSLSYLLRFPFNVIKIDRSFICGVHQDRKRAETVRAIIHMACELNMKVIAEGIEVAEELEHLRLADCDMVQGYLLSKPLPAHELERTLAAGKEWSGYEDDPRAAQAPAFEVWSAKTKAIVPRYQNGHILEIAKSSVASKSKAISTNLA